MNVSSAAECVGEYDNTSLKRFQYAGLAKKTPAADLRVNTAVYLWYNASRRVLTGDTR